MERPARPLRGPAEHAALLLANRCQMVAGVKVTRFASPQCLLWRQTADLSVQACETGEWVDLDRSTVINTSWAVIALLTAKYPDPEPIKKACRLIMNRQQPNGEWLWESTVSHKIFKCRPIDLLML